MHQPTSVRQWHNLKVEIPAVNFFFNSLLSGQIQTRGQYNRQLVPHLGVRRIEIYKLPANARATTVVPAVDLRFSSIQILDNAAVFSDVRDRINSIFTFLRIGVEVEQPDIGSFQKLEASGTSNQKCHQIIQILIYAWMNMYDLQISHVLVLAPSD